MRDEDCCRRKTTPASFTMTVAFAGHCVNFCCMSTMPRVGGGGWGLSCQASTAWEVP